MKCPCCGNEIEPHQMDIAFGLPDSIFSLSEEQRSKRAKLHSDLCSLDDTQYFIRGVLYIPVQQLSTNFGWGVWAEVSREIFFRYLDMYDQDGSNESPAAGILANALPNYPAMEYPLEIHFGPPDKRPTFNLTPTNSELYREQMEGLPVRKWHSIVDHYN